MLSNREQKEKQVIELYKQNKTIREIAKDVHMSFGDISSTIKKFTGEEDFKEKTISKDTQAIKLFSQGKTPVDIVIELDITTDEANRIYRDFWKLKRLYQLNTIYDEIKNDMPSFLKLFRMMKEKEITEKDILELFRYSNQIHSLARVIQSLYKKIKILTQQKDIVSSELYDLQNDIEQSKNLAEQYQSELDILTQKIKRKSAYLEAIENSIDNLMENDERYLKIKKIVKDKVEGILNNKKDLLMASIVTVLLAIRGEPNKGMLIDYFGTYYDYDDNFNNTNNIENSPHPIISYIQTYHKPILEITNMLCDKILKIIQNQILPSLSEQ